jgi:hypothetical protein
MAERPAASDKSILEKLRYKSGQRSAVLNAPPAYQSTLAQMAGPESALEGTFDFIHVFATERQQLVEEGPKWRGALAPNGLLWVSYPKGKAVKTDLNRDVVRVALQQVGLETVSQVSIDEVWSALRAKAV